jgi:DNA end-binding protein Ku
MYGASEDLRVPFHEVHEADSGRVRHRKFCEVCGNELRMSDIRKGYEVAGHMLTFSDEEVQALRPVASRSMHLAGFCDREEVPLVAIDRPFYIGTETGKKGGVSQPFALLHAAMLKSGKVAIVTWVTRASEQTGMLVPYDRGFLLKAILFAKQIRPFEQVEVEAATVAPELVDMGVQLIDKMSFRFQHESYVETYSKTIHDVIEAKAMGREIKIEPPLQKSEAQSLRAELQRLLA